VVVLACGILLSGNLDHDLRLCDGTSATSFSARTGRTTHGEQAIGGDGALAPRLNGSVMKP